MKQKRPFSFLCTISYLGYKYHGWQKQPNVKTIQGLIERALSRSYPEADIATLGASRTDAGVSCSAGYFQIFSSHHLDAAHLPDTVNAVLPQDIRFWSCKELTSSFNLIQSIDSKRYIYRFANESQIHPFASHRMVNFPGALDWELMEKAAETFLGAHDFSAFSADFPHPNPIRRISHCTLKKHPSNEAFFPTNSYGLEVEGSGFLRNQIRIMMGCILAVGEGKISLAELSSFLHSPKAKVPIAMVPAQGLTLEKISLRSEA